MNRNVTMYYLLCKVIHKNVQTEDTRSWHRVTYSDNSATGNDDACGVRHLPLAVARDARVVADVFVPDVADAQLRAVIKDAHCAWGLHGVFVLIP